MTAPTARNMKARGKREAKRSASPLVTNCTRYRGLKGRNTQVITPFQGWKYFDCFTRGDALASLRACPWLSYSAPLALRTYYSAALALRRYSGEKLRNQYGTT